MLVGKEVRSIMTTEDYSNNKILHIIDSLEVGGAERLLVDTVNGLEEFDHHVISLSDKASLRTSLKGNVKFSSLGFKSKLDTLRCAREIRRYIRENKISVVHSHLVMGNILARLGTPRNVPVFNTLHTLAGARFFSPRGGWRKWLERFSYRKRHHLIAVSNEVLSDYRASIGIKGKTTVLYNFVEDKFFVDQSKSFVAGGDLKAVAVGTLKEAKNFRFLIEAFRHLPPEISLEIFGDGPLRTELQVLIDQLNVNVKLRGSHPAVETILRNYDLFLMSSLYEGHPIALVEAMACGLPAVVTDIPVLREATGNHGLFYTPGNHGEFARMMKDIASGSIDINPYAAHNLEYANKIGRKSQYLSTLKRLYLDALADSGTKLP